MLVIHVPAFRVRIWSAIMHVSLVCVINSFSLCLLHFKIINFPNMCSNIPASPAYGVYISQLIRYARASSNYSDFLKRHLHLRNRLLDQGYKKIRLIRSLKKFIFRYQYLVEIYSVSAEKIISDAFSYSENKEVRNVKKCFLSMCDVKIFVTFTSPNMVLL